jgi:hypothetical protein
VIDSRTWLEVAGAAAASAPWLLAVGIVYIRRRPTKPRAARPTLDLGTEPPAVANFLVHDFRVTREAVPATLFDLAARRVVEIEERGPERYVCRIRGQDASLTAYERRVVDLLARRERGGIVPAEALTTGPEGEASRWWNDFRREVVADAQRRGLSLDILDGRTLRRLTIGALAPAAVVALLFNFNVGLGYWLCAAFVLGAVMTRHTQRDTPAGLEAASHWLGVRAALEEDEVFPTLPPIVVALWERHLAYGAAFGVARVALRAIPMGAESATRAWSAYGGSWRPVRVRYPHYFPPGWGIHPVATLLRAGFVGAIAVFVLAVVTPVVSDAGSGAIVLLFIAVPTVVAISAGLFVLASITDLLWTREVTGQILRLRAVGSDDDERHYVALDDGRSPTIRAFRVRYELYSGLGRDQVVTATVTRNFRYVREIGRAA